MSNNKYKEQLKRVPTDKKFMSQFAQLDVEMLKGFAKDCKEFCDDYFFENMCDAAITYITEEMLTLQELTPLFVALWVHKNVPFMKDTDIDELVAAADKALKRVRSIAELEALGYEFNPVLMLRVVQLNRKLLERLAGCADQISKVHDRVVRYRKKLFEARRNRKQR